MEIRLPLRRPCSGRFEGSRFLMQRPSCLRFSCHPPELLSLQVTLGIHCIVWQGSQCFFLTVFGCLGFGFLGSGLHFAGLGFEGKGLLCRLTSIHKHPRAIFPDILHL